MADCLFCSIVAGEIPSETVAETDSVVAFLVTVGVMTYIVREVKIDVTVGGATVPTAIAAQWLVPIGVVVTLVVGGQPLTLTDLAGAVGQVLALTGQGTKLKPAVAEVAGRTGLAKNLLYDRALQAGRDRGGE